MATASRVLWALSGRKYGVSTRSIRPMPICGRHRCWRWFEGYANAWVDVGPGRSCACSCPTNSVDTFDVPFRPVHAITVLVDGVELVEGTDYRLDNWRYLRRLGGLMWPDSQNLSLDIDQPGTWGFTVSYGRLVPPDGILAVQALACELLELGKPGCKLPARVRNVSRPGLSYDVLSPADFLVKGRTGIELVDLFLAVENPTGQRSPSLVVNPEDYASFAETP